MEQTRLLTIKQATHEYQLSRDRLRQLINSGQVASVRFGPQSIRILRDSMESYVQRAASGDIPEAAPAWMDHAPATR